MKETGAFMKGLGAGMIVGATAITVGKIMINNNKNLSKGSTKVIKAVSDLVDGVQTVFK